MEFLKDQFWNQSCLKFSHGFGTKSKSGLMKSVDNKVKHNCHDRKQGKIT